jgi:hypothetical protein
MPSIAEL